MKNDKTKLLRKGAFTVHTRPRGMRDIHYRYGLWIIGGGICHADIDCYYRCPERYFEFYSLSHLLEGRGRLWLPEKGEQIIEPGQYVLVAPGQVHRYGGADGQPYVEEAIRFYGTAMDAFLNCGVLENGVFDFCRVRRINAITKLAADPADSAQINANALLQQLLIDLYNIRLAGASDSEPMEELLSLLRKQIDRWWTVEEMAQLLSLSLDQFRRVFKKHTGMLPKAYIDQLKIQKAGEMLLTSRRLKITDIARKLGYVDQYHFSRRFKQLTGFSPRQYRQALLGH